MFFKNLDNFKVKVIEFITIAYEEVRDIAIKTKDDLYKFLISPILTFITDYITNPIALLIAKLIEHTQFFDKYKLIIKYKSSIW